MEGKDHQTTNQYDQDQAYDPNAQYQYDYNQDGYYNQYYDQNYQYDGQQQTEYYDQQYQYNQDPRAQSEFFQSNNDLIQGGQGDRAESMGFDKLNEELLNNEGRAPGKITLIKDLQSNDGTMKLEIKQVEQKGTGMKKFTVYNIVGYDSLGEINVLRRYSEFDLFRSCLFSRYPGLYIPPLPPKQNSGKTEEMFVAERRYFLEQFLDQLCKLKYLVKSPELQIFFRPPAKVEEGFKTLEIATTDLILDYYKKNIKISGMDITEQVLMSYSTTINDFVKEQRLISEELRRFKHHIRTIVPIKQQEIEYYVTFSNFLTKYEEANEKCQGKTTKLVSGDSKAHLKNKLNYLSKQQANPFIHIRNWIKGELFDLSALMDAIGQKESCDARKAASVKLLAQERERQAKLSQGKFSFKDMIKGQQAKKLQAEQLLLSIAQREKDIINWDSIKRFLTVYLAEVAIPNYKRHKDSKYVHGMHQFSEMELKNANVASDTWKDFHDLCSVYINKN